MALAEWSLTPDYINEAWTPEILWVMFQERKKDIERKESAMRGDEPRRVVSDTTLFEKMNYKKKVPTYVNTRK